jgi:hypothetical protein
LYMQRLVVTDNDSTHRSWKTEHWLQSGYTQIIHIPSHSPDLNIGENLFANLASRVETLKHNARSDFRRMD